VTSTYKIPVHRYVTAGQYDVKLRVYAIEQNGLRPLPVTIPGSLETPSDLNLGPIRILDPDHSRKRENELMVHLGEQIQLLGYDLAERQLTADKPLEVTLYWRAAELPDGDYTVFTQLLGPDGKLWAQRDNQPQNGSFPTSTWPLNDVIVDRYRLKLAEGAPQGSYQLLVGMYNLATGERLPARDARGQRFYNDAVVIEPITFE
jgi:hypothetical protein